ncbi:hypothetical protein R1flu_003328 [Riccia fluitans]|uniref:Protein kinase domain-containing protein n=1 Tax=Riccia fluitans TaxID=41844 RepID=A0ABD1Y8Q1_9MARC
MEVRSKCYQWPPEFEVPRWTISFWKVFCVIAVVLPVTSIISQDTSGFISINCGGDNLIDPDTNISWSMDGGYLASSDQLSEEGVSIPAAVSFGDIASSIYIRVGGVIYRNLDLYLEDEGTRTPWNSTAEFWTVEKNRSAVRWDDREELFSGAPTLWITKSENSTLPAMVNAFEIYGEFAAETTRTTDVDGKAIREFAGAVGSFIDTAGDPCLPVSWRWLGCSIEIPPRITMINLTSMGVNGNITTNFGLLNRLSILDLSSNSFSGSLPRSLLEVQTLRELSLSDNQFTGNLSPLFKALGPGSTVSKIDLSQNHFTGSIPEDVQQLANLEELGLSNASLSGPLPSGLFRLSKLTTLSLENNMLTGTVSDDIWSTTLTELRTVNLGNNSFTELNLTTWSRTVSARGFDAYQQRVVLLGNHITNIIISPDELSTINRWSQPVKVNSNGFQPGFLLTPGNLTLSKRYLCRRDPSEDYWNLGHGGVSKTPLIVVSVVVVLLMACILLFFLGRMLRRTRQLRQIQKALAKEDVRPPIYSYDDLKAATKAFSQENQIGKGAFGSVYKGELADGTIIAVKRLLSVDQSIPDFLKEMVMLTGIKHRHLLLLKGCCVRDRKRMLVYEYAENGNLADALWGKDRRRALTWEQRLKIAIGVAKGLACVHEELQPKIIHRGYFSPEYATQGVLTDKLDVYSYGILLLEIVSGRQCIDTTAPPEQTFLKDWASAMTQLRIGLV